MRLSCAGVKHCVDNISVSVLFGRTDLGKMLNRSCCRERWWCCVCLDFMNFLCHQKQKIWRLTLCLHSCCLSYAGCVLWTKPNSSIIYCFRTKSALGSLFWLHPDFPVRSLLKKCKKWEIFEVQSVKLPWSSVIVSILDFPVSNSVASMMELWFCI